MEAGQGKGGGQLQLDMFFKERTNNKLTEKQSKMT